MNDEAEKDYNLFKKEMCFQDTYIPECNLLYLWYTINSMNPNIVSTYGKKYFNVTEEEINEIYCWMEETREALATGKTEQLIHLIRYITISVNYTYD